MSASSKKHRRMIEDEIYELKDIHSNDDNSSLIDSPRPQKNINLKKLRPKNRISSPQFSPESNNESSITLSPITKNAFFAKDPQYRGTTTKSTSAKSSSIYSDQSDQSQHIPNVNEKYEKISSNLSNVEAQSNISDKSNLKLYREHIRNRFLSKKQQAGFTAIQAKKQERKRKHKVKKLKNEIELETEDSYLNIELSNHSKKREFLRKKKSIEGDLFDCHISITEEPLNGQNKDKVDDIESNRQEQTIIDLLHLDEKEIINFVKPIICKEIYNPTHLCEIDQDIETMKKIDDDVELRYLEDEGFYVGEKPPISKKMLSVLEKRLLATGNRKWFGCDGQLKFLSDPRREVLLKPSIDIPISPELLTIFKFPIKYEPGLLSFTSQTNEKHSLKIHLLKIKFKHHPLFSPKHFLAHRLENLYVQHSSNTNEMNYIKLHNKLKTLRQAKQKILQTLEVNPENVTGKQKDRLQRYSNDIRKIRELRLEEYKKYRFLVKSILKIWKYLKQVREKQNFTNTSIRLTIKKEKCSYEDEKKEWDNFIEIETNEIYEEKKLQYKEELQEYRMQLKEWKSNKSNEEEKPEKPIKDFSIESIRKNISDKFVESLKPPGEPRLHFELHFDREITKIVNFPREKARRNAVNKTKLTIKIFFDDLQVFKTNSVFLNDTFVCDLNQIISIECGSVPKNIFIEIQEEYRSSNNKWSFKKIILSPPNSDITFENVETQRHEFNHTETVIYTHTGIGMGHNFQNIFHSYSLENIESMDDIYLSGLLHMKLGWDNEHSIPLSTNTISSLTEADQFDPQDPQNKDYVSFIKKSNDNDDIKNYFRLNVGEDIFCTDDDIENNPRYRMLSLRAKGEYEFQNEVVPNRENEIDLNIFANYEKRKKEEMETFTIDDYTYENQIDTQRQWGIRQYQQILKRAIDHCKTADKTYSLKNILVDDEVPDLSFIFFSFMKWFQPKRPLRPSRKSSNQNALPVVSTNNVLDLKIVINIVQAFQIPIRRTGAIQEMTMSPAKRSNSDLFSLIPVRPLVIATFGKERISTTTAEGSNPTWNQELILTTQYRQNETLNESICLNIFDEHLVDILEDDRYRQIDIHQRRQLHWLASLEIPLQTVTETNRIEGTFEMNSPSFMIGYEKVNQNKDDTITLTPKSIFESRDSIYLNLFVTLIPPIKGGQLLKDDNLECHEVPNVENHIREWQDEYKIEFPSRSFPILIKDSNCKTCCITRFLKALNPPNFDRDIIQAPVENFCMRLVSLIPFKTNTHYEGIWLTSDQFLKLQIGSISDHAVLLQCYFMHLNIESWLAFGYCMLQGNTTFIVYKQISDSNEKLFYAINVVTGCKYDVRHSFNPFKRIYCLINHENVWGNIQKEDQMNLIRYDITKSSDWLPLFTKQITSPMSSFQPSILEYLPLTDIQKLEDRIEIKLKSKIMKWRQHTRTSWNRHASFLMKQLLPLLEKHQILGNTTSAIDFSDNQNLTLDIQTLMNTHKTYGFPLNMPYTTIRRICEAVYKTNIHNNDAPNIEFALAVHLHEYTGGILVVWIYICTLIRRR